MPQCFLPSFQTRRTLTAEDSIPRSESACPIVVVIAYLLTVNRLELESEKIHALGQHDDAISSVRYSSEASAFASFISIHQALNIVIDAIITGSWDRTVRFWDPRASIAQQSSQQLPERIYFMDTVGHRLVVALASRLFHIFDLRKMDTPEQTRESSLKFLTRALACMSDGQGTPHATLTFPRSSS